MSTKDLSTLSVGEIVANDFRTAAIFKSAGIDFCCGGKKSLAESCQEKGINPVSLEKEIAEITANPQIHSLNFNEWDLDFLCDYVMNTHHRYVLKTLPELVFYTQKIASVHGGHHAELLEIASLFAKINEELLQHLGNEENVLFPAIKRLLKTESAEDKATIISEIARMSGEHEFAGGAMDQIAVISGHYKVPDDGCNTYAVTYRLLQEFEDDLHVHVHLENNILYPKALKLASN